MTKLFHCSYGSRLYRLHSEASDYDSKSVVLPSLEDCVLQRVVRNQQQKDEEARTEHEGFSIQEFCRLLASSQAIAIEMLHVNDEDIIIDSDIFRTLRRERKIFYTKRMTAMLSFSKSMCLKYAVRADRMAAVQKVIEVLVKFERQGVAKLYQCWDDLPDGEHIVRTTSLGNRDAVDKRIYEVAGKGLPATISPAYGLEILRKIRDAYGERVRAAKSMSGKDMKSLSHSYRVGYQLKHIYQDGGFTFPLPESDFIRDVKFGRLSYLDDKLEERLDDLISEVERLAEASDYPEKVDQKWLDSIILSAYNMSS